MRYSLRTLIIVMMLGGPALAGAWWLWTLFGSLAIFPLVLVLSAAVTLRQSSSLKVFLFATYYQWMGAIAGIGIWAILFGRAFGTPGGDALEAPLVAAIIGAAGSLSWNRQALAQTER